ncbi:uncharacterized protein B0T15DRAFT_509560 [Chaetomium strumarium]|uniref:Dystroglycan-type cadherin-like domain-containing protein n=1 Tax=Chaetomium strumarium TaxID=1170767 RepID=A0AAJ0GZT4_9PEZI|nr:hypothetical protein B0T15DRAFT_509560 [Chaetomium strumarium]
MVSPVPAWAVVLLLAALSTAAPTISFPINSQVPPVARIGEPFSFVFSPSTFSSSSPITYSLSNPPNWLSIDSKSRRLFGIPEEDDVAPGRVIGVPLSVVATDDSGSTTLPATLVVSRGPAPKVRIPLEEQVPDFGTFSPPSAIISSPSQAFSFRLRPDTFSDNPGAPISYYATMADNTPLPAWVSFDPGSLSFTGRTPPSESLVQPPQHFAFRVIAGDVPGFAGATLSFDIVVGTHQLTADETRVVLSATPGSPVSYTGLRSRVKIDGKPPTAQTATIVSVSNMPSWLSVDKDTWHISGTPPETAESTNLTVTIRDTYSNVLNVTVAVEVAHDKAGLFKGSVPEFTITAGEPFSFDLRPYLSKPEDTDVSVETDSSHSWIQFNPHTITLFGDAPGEVQDSAVDVNVNAKSKSSKEAVSLSFSILIRAASDGKGSTPTSDPTQTTDCQRSLGGDDSGKERFNPVLLAILLPLLVLLALATCALFWYFRRRKDSRKPALSTRDVSGPITGTFVARTAEPSVSRALPDFTKRFGKSFSADDVWGIEKNEYFESRSSFKANPDPSQRFGAARLLPPNGSPFSDRATAPEVTPVINSVSPGISRPGTRGKISSSLSSVTEASFGEIVDSRGLDSAGSDSRRSFRDRVEVNVPRLPQTPGSAHTRTPSSANAMETPRIGSSLTAPDTGSVPPRPESRFSYHPPAAVARKASWPWLKGIMAKRQVSKLLPEMRRLSEQPSVLTVETLESEKNGQPSGTPRLNNGTGASVHDLPSLPLLQFPSRASFDRSPARSGTAAGGYSGDLNLEQPESSSTANLIPPGPSMFGGQESSMTSFPDQRGIAADRPNLYDDLVMPNPFSTSRTWSTMPTTDEWVDETVESLALSRSTTQQQQNWTALQGSPSPVISGGRDATAPTSLPELVSSLRLPQLPTGFDESLAVPTPASLKPKTAPVGSSKGVEIPELLGLAHKSQSNGLSLRSEGSKSDHAVFI